MNTFRDMEIEAERGCSVFDAGDQLRDYVYRLTLEALDEADRLELPDADSVELRKQYVRKHFLEAIGGLPDRKPPLSPCVTGTVACDGYHVEKVIFQSSEEVWVSCSLYLPERGAEPVELLSAQRVQAPSDRSGGPGGGWQADVQIGCLPVKFPAVLFVCGHDPDGKQAAEYQRACIALVRAGMAVLAMDSYGQGERSSYYDEAFRKERIGRCTREHDYAGFQCMLLGGSTARYLLWDAIRAVDYLVDRTEIDASRIGITGNSGGGTLTMMMMIADDRIAAAAPGTFVTSRRQYLQAGQPQDNEQIWPGLTRLGIDHRDGVLCMAPKPVLLLTAEHDFFPRRGTAETYAWCKRIWGLYGREEQLRLYQDDCMHTYSQGMAERAALFFRGCFEVGGSTEENEQRLGLERDGQVLSLAASEQGLSGHVLKSISILHSPQLWCTSTGYLSQEKKSLGIYDQNLALYRKILENCSIPDYKRTISYLKDLIFRNRRPGELFPRKARETSLVLDLCCDSWIWEPQEGIRNHCFLFYMGKEPKPVTIALWRDGCRRITDHSGWIRSTCRSGRAVLVLDVTGIGMMQQREFLSWTDRESFYGARFKLNADLLWLNDCLMALGCFDVLRSLDLAERIPGLEKEEIRLFVSGRYSLYGDIAALLDGRISSVDYECPQESFAEIVRDKYYDPLGVAAFVLPGILKYADIPDIQKWRLSLAQKERTRGVKMKVIISENAVELGRKAAVLTAGYLREAIEEKGYARMILSTGASQFTTLEALVQEDIDWSRVEMFHLDEYVNLPQTHPASFIKYLKERFVQKVGALKTVHFVDTSEGTDQTIEKLTAELQVGPVDVGLIGIGENAHIAFNDPPADFENPASYLVVNLDEDCRRQQLGEGWFPVLDDVPKQAVSMTVSQILKCRHIISAVPYQVKAQAIKKTLENEVTNRIPATVLKTHPDVTVFVDMDSASAVDGEVLERYL